MYNVQHWIFALNGRISPKRILLGPNTLYWIYTCIKVSGLGPARILPCPHPKLQSRGQSWQLTCTRTCTRIRDIRYLQGDLLHLHVDVMTQISTMCVANCSLICDCFINVRHMRTRAITVRLSVCDHSSASLWHVCDKLARSLLNLKLSNLRNSPKSFLSLEL